MIGINTPVNAEHQLTNEDAQHSDIRNILFELVIPDMNRIQR